MIPGIWPRLATDGESFIVVDHHRRQAYRIPAPSAGAVDEVVRRIELLTNRNAAARSVVEDDATSQSPIGPAEALHLINKTVVLEMQVKSVNYSGKKKWLYLNSEQDYSNATNFSIAIQSPSEERLKELGLESDAKKLTGLWLRATGQVSLHHNVPRLFIAQPGQLRVLVEKDRGRSTP